MLCHCGNSLFVFEYCCSAVTVSTFHTEWARSLWSTYLWFTVMESEAEGSLWKWLCHLHSQRSLLASGIITRAALSVQSQLTVSMLYLPDVPDVWSHFWGDFSHRVICCLCTCSCCWRFPLMQKHKLSFSLVMWRILIETDLYSASTRTEWSEGDAWKPASCHLSAWAYSSWEEASDLFTICFLSLWHLMGLSLDEDWLLFLHRFVWNSEPQRSW